MSKGATSNRQRLANLRRRAKRAEQEPKPKPGERKCLRWGWVRSGTAWQG